MAIAIRDISLKIYHSDKFKIGKIKGLKEVKKQVVQKPIVNKKPIMFY